MEDSLPPDIQRSGNVDTLPAVHKIIKYETLTGLPSLSGVPAASGNASVLSQSQTPVVPSLPSPSSSPLNFVSQPPAPPSPQPRPIEPQFDALSSSPQVGVSIPAAASPGQVGVTLPAVSQIFDSKPPTSNTQWSSMFYYSQLASQFGINPDYTYVSSGASTAVPISDLTGNTLSHLTPYVTHVSGAQTAGTTTRILLPQSELPQDEMGSPEQSQHGNIAQRVLNMGSPDPAAGVVSHEAIAPQASQVTTIDLEAVVANQNLASAGSEVSLHPHSDIIEIRHLSDDSPDPRQTLRINNSELILQYDKV